MPNVGQSDNAFRRASEDAKGQAVAIAAVGASAGGLDAFIRLLNVFPADTGMAIILVQHLDPLHESFMTDLLAPH